MNIFEKYRDAEIATKITFTYSACFALLLIVINAVAYFGTFYALYHPAELTIKHSMISVRELLMKLEKDVDAFDPNSIRDPLVAGVVLRVVDDYGNVFVDTDPHYPAVEVFEENIMSEPPILADDDMEVAAIGNALVYRAKMDYVHADEHVTMHFFRTITSEQDFINDLENILLVLDVLAIIAAVFVGSIVSKNILNPIKLMTERAQKITFGKLEGRIPISTANDELTELAKTFNAMLDRLQGGKREFVSQQQHFVSNASHELRNPATVIIGYIDLLERYGMKDKARLDECIDAIRSEAHNMKDLVEKLLFVTRSDQGKQIFNKSDFDLSEVVADIVKKMQMVITTHEVSLSENVPAQIHADRVAINQMLRIFLDNAVKYTPAGGSIKVKSVVDGGVINLSISDTGIGIAPEHRDKIFERFFVVNKNNPVGDSTGLGLSMAKEIADNHNITIEVDSELGRGTTFTIRIPTASRR